MKGIHILFMILVFVACQSKESQQADTKTLNKVPEKKSVIDYSQYPDLLVKALKAHGGLDTWQSYGALSFDKITQEGNSETHTINLYNRKALIDRDTTKIGFDGEQVWVSPNLEAFGNGSARFYHNLYFYFFGIPFLLSDPGIIYEDLGTASVNNKQYRALKVSYKDGVGDSDKDLYIAHFNPETYRLEVLLYTVTYHSGKESDKYKALVYNNWQKVDGLLVPQSFVGYVYENGSLGDKRYEATFENVTFKKETPGSELFDQPADSEIDSLKIK